MIQNATLGHKHEWTEDKRKRSVRPFISQISGDQQSQGTFQ